MYPYEYRCVYIYIQKCTYVHVDMYTYVARVCSYKLYICVRLCACMSLYICIQGYMIEHINAYV